MKNILNRNPLEDSALDVVARRTLAACMGVQAGEYVVVITDTATRAVGEALAAAAGSLEAEGILGIMEPRRINGEEPPAAIAAMMASARVLLLATKVSLSSTQARKRANDAGARAASMPGITPEIMYRTMGVDYQDVANRSRALAATLAGVKTLRATSALGTDITLAVEGVEFGADTGLYLQPGDFGNLPAGEVCGGPRLQGSSGVAVFDGSFAGVGLIREPIRIVFENGVATAIDGGAEARALAGLIAPFGMGGKTLAEIGIGTHPTAKITGAVLEDEKVAGSIHLAIGNNVGFGGDNDVKLHLDGVIVAPTLTTNAGQVLIDAGVPRF